MGWMEEGSIERDDLMGAAFEVRKKPDERETPIESTRMSQAKSPSKRG